MRELLGGLVTAQFLGYMMKTGGCPQPGDIKNMIKAAESAVEPVLEAMERVEEVRRNHERKEDARRLANQNARYAVTEKCMDNHPAEARTVVPQMNGRSHLSNPLCAACAKTLEALP